MPYGPAEVRARDVLARILLVAPPKAGKTTSAAITSPGPVYIMNTDGKGALDGLWLNGLTEPGSWAADDINTFGDYQRALIYIKQNAAKYKTVIFDNLSTFAMAVEDEIRKELRDDPRVIYPELKRRLTRVVRDLNALPLHVIYVSQVEQNENPAAGGFDHLLAVSGGAKVTIPMLVQDWIWLEVAVDPKTGKMTREFLLAPQGTWRKAVRSIKDVERIEANVSLFLDLVRERGVATGAPEEEVVEEEQAASEEEQAAAEEEQAEEQATAAEEPVAEEPPAKPATFKPKAPTTRVAMTATPSRSQSPSPRAHQRNGSARAR